jgi:hypothetical protein
LQTLYSEATVENTLLLVDFASEAPYLELLLELVVWATEELHKQRLLRSEQSMHIWTLAHSLRSDPGLSEIRPELFEAAFHTLHEHHEAFVRIFYRRYVDSPDGTLFGRMHRRNPVLCALLLQFASVYFDGSWERTRRLLVAARELESFEVVGHLLSRMGRCTRPDTFEAFQICVLANQRLASEEFEPQSAETKALFQQLLLQAPGCVRLLLDTHPFQLVNKFTGTPLCNTGGPSAPEGQATPLSLRPLASLRVKLLAVQLQLELGPVRPDGSLGASVHDGTEWMVRPHDQHHVRIHSEKGKLEDEYKNHLERLWVQIRINDHR